LTDTLNKRQYTRRLEVSNLSIKRTGYKTYTKEFKLEAIRLISLSDKPSAEIAAKLGIRHNMLFKWKEQLESKDDAAFPIRTGRPLKENQSEKSK
jgi:transposase